VFHQPTLNPQTCNVTGGLRLSPATKSVKINILPLHTKSPRQQRWRDAREARLRRHSGPLTEPLIYGLRDHMDQGRRRRQRNTAELLHPEFKKHKTKLQPAREAFTHSPQSPRCDGAARNTHGSERGRADAEAGDGVEHARQLMGGMLSLKSTSGGHTPGSKSS
jgi:hypothetical protein